MTMATIGGLAIKVGEIRCACVGVGCLVGQPAGMMTRGEKRGERRGTRGDDYGAEIRSARMVLREDGARTKKVNRCSCARQQGSDGKGSNQGQQNVEEGVGRKRGRLDQLASPLPTLGVVVGGENGVL